MEEAVGTTFIVACNFETMRMHSYGTGGPQFNGLIGGEGVSAIAKSPLNRMYFKNTY
jgi:hypothetical protein